MAAAKRAAMVHNAFFILVGFVHHLGIERMAQRIGYRALELGVERRRSECGSGDWRRAESIADAASAAHSTGDRGD